MKVSLSCQVVNGLAAIQVAGSGSHSSSASRRGIKQQASQQKAGSTVQIITAPEAQQEKNRSKRRRSWTIFYSGLSSVSRRVCSQKWSFRARGPAESSA